MAKITYYGHSCFGVELKGKHILFDPFITPNDLAKKIDIMHIPADYILVSHGHNDHVADLENLAAITGAQIICNYEIYEWLDRKGVKNIHPVNTGGKVKLDFGTVKCVTAHHSSGLPDGSYGGNPMGFLIDSEPRFYYAGDTALTLDMKLIPHWCQPDFAFLPIGDNFTMDVDDAIHAADFIQCNDIIGMHYDTFGYIKIDHQQAMDDFASKGKKLTLMGIGESINK